MISQWPDTGRLAGIDFGTVRVGIALCDPSQRWVNPHETLTRRTASIDAGYFVDLVASESIVGWVMGLPIHCDGQESEKSAEARKFARWLTEITQLPVRFSDERFSSRQATQMLHAADLSRGKKKKQLDSVAASVILQTFLERPPEQRGQTEFGGLE
jgi:putative Holliday junction resolvase